MISKKINKSQELIFIGPNYLKFAQFKPPVKKSLPTVSPKGVSKISSVKILHKPIKKQSKLCSHNVESTASVSHLKANLKLESTSKRSKSKMIISHLSSDRLKKELNEDTSQKKAATSRNLQQWQIGGLGKEQQSNEQSQKYQKLLLRSKRLLKKYCSELRRALEQIQFLKQENAMLRHRHNM